MCEWAAKESPDTEGGAEAFTKKRLHMKNSWKPLFGYTGFWTMSRKGQGILSLIPDVWGCL